jgi:hypothetical protein
VDLISAEPIKVFSARDKRCGKEMMEYYRDHQILLVRGDEENHRTWKDPMDGLREIWRRSKKSAKDVLRKSWSVENACGGKPEFLTPDALFHRMNASSSFYVSCIAQTDASLVKEAEKLIPFETPAPPFMFAGAKHSEPLWFFVGYNNSDQDSMVGRPEHTDVVSHSGTWHIQLAGCKRWLLRPSESKEWGGKAPRLVHGERLSIDCLQGDILFINTRLWMHHTQIPHYVSRFGTLSFSIAKDFYCDSVVPAGGATADSWKKQRTENDTEEFTNIETIFASRSVRKGAIVLRESELPDCSLPRSLKANCEVATVEDEDGNEEFCLLARCNIKAGDCLAVLPSDDDDDEGDDEDDEIGF